MKNIFIIGRAKKIHGPIHISYERRFMRSLLGGGDIGSMVMLSHTIFIRFEEKRTITHLRMPENLLREVLGILERRFETEVHSIALRLGRLWNAPYRRWTVGEKFPRGYTKFFNKVLAEIDSRIF